MTHCCLKFRKEDISMKKRLGYIIFSIIIVALLVCCVYLYTVYKDSQAIISELRIESDLMNKQIIARNRVIDKELELNIDNPLSLSKNFEQVKTKYWGKGVDKKILSDEMAKEIIVPLYTPDGHYFGEISYRAFSAIHFDYLQEYESINDDELQILHSYMNYIELNPGMSLVQHN